MIFSYALLSGGLVVMVLMLNLIFETMKPFSNEISSSLIQYTNKNEISHSMVLQLGVFLTGLCTCEINNYGDE